MAITKRTFSITLTFDSKGFGKTNPPNYGFKGEKMTGEDLKGLLCEAFKEEMSISNVEAGSPCRKHSYEFRFGVMQAPCCQVCGATPKRGRVTLAEPKDHIAFAVHDHCVSDCSRMLSCPTIQWVIEENSGDYCV